MVDFKALFGITSERFFLAIGQTFYMVGIALVIGVLIGVPLGVILILTRPGGLHPIPILYAILNTVINIIRSVPFVILILFIMPLAKVLIGTSTGTTAAIIPLICYSAPYLARLIEGSLLEVNPGILEAAKSMGASTFQTVWHFILPEAAPTLILAITTGAIGLIGASAMAGAVGGGGVGNLALTYGYQQSNTPLMLLTITVLVIFIHLIQMIGDMISKKLRVHS